MLFSSSTLSALALHASLAAAGSVFPSYNFPDTGANEPRNVPSLKHTRASTAPFVESSPFSNAKSPSRSEPRHKVCGVKSHNDGVTDDAPYILDAINKCNNGGHVIFNETLYIVGTAMDLTNLSSIDIELKPTSEILFTNDTDYWQANGFYQVYQNATTFFQLGGTDVNFYGGGTINGNGQVWWDLYAVDIYILRPILFASIGLHDSTISNLKLRNSPEWYNFVANSSTVTFSEIDITGYSQSSHVAKNTDGWDVYRSDSIVIQNSVINNGDDCVSFKPNSTNIIVQNLHCNGSHGISVGSLGQYVEEVDYVENIYVYNVSMYNASDMARIKIWPGSAAALSGDLQGGGGTGLVRNVTYDTCFIDNVDYAIQVTQCYGQSNFTACEEYPSSLKITDVLFKNFQGTTSDAYDPLSGTIVCSSNSTCSNIVAEDINVYAPSGAYDEFQCANVDESLLAVNCTEGAPS